MIKKEYIFCVKISVKNQKTQTKLTLKQINNENGIVKKINTHDKPMRNFPNVFDSPSPSSADKKKFNIIQKFNSNKENYKLFTSQPIHKPGRSIACSNIDIILINKTFQYNKKPLSL